MIKHKYVYIIVYKLYYYLKRYVSKYSKWWQLKNEDFMYDQMNNLLVRNAQVMRIYMETRLNQIFIDHEKWEVIAQN